MFSTFKDNIVINTAFVRTQICAEIILTLATFTVSNCTAKSFKIKLM